MFFPIGFVFFPFVIPRGCLLISSIAITWSLNFFPKLRSVDEKSARDVIASQNEIAQSTTEILKQSCLKKFNNDQECTKNGKDIGKGSPSQSSTYIKSRLTTAAAEGLNNKIKTLRRMGYGYTSSASYCRKILQRCGYLNHLSINTDEFFYRWPNPAKSRR